MLRQLVRIENITRPEWNFIMVHPEERKFSETIHTQLIYDNSVTKFNRRTRQRMDPARVAKEDFNIIYYEVTLEEI